MIELTLCREHHFGSDKRCTYCQMQERYYAEAMTTLKKWSKEEIESDKRHYEMVLDSIMCNVHSHDENPLHKLFDMEEE